MALRQCPDCNASISRSAASCPTCGYVPRVVRGRKACYALAAISFAVMTLTINNPTDAMFFKVGFAGVMISGVTLSALLAW